MPTAADVGARPNTWLPTAKEMLATICQNTAYPTYIPVFGNNYEDYGFATVQNIKTAMAITAEDVGAVAKSALKSLAYSQTNANGDASTDGLTSYPTTPGVFRVISPITGLPTGVLGYGSLVIFDGGSYLLHIYQDASGHLYWARTSDGVVVPTADSWRHFFDSKDVIHVANGGTGASDAATARNNLELPNFRTYYFTNGENPLRILQNNWHLIGNGDSLIYCVAGGTHYTLVGFKVDNYCAFMEIGYGTADIYKYRYTDGTWTMHTYKAG